MPESNGQSVWAVTTYFNPMRYRRRLANFHVFRAALQVPLLAIELSFGQTPELGDGDADKLIHSRGRDVLWQKERLLNLAIKALPASCSKVVCLDCDILFTRPDWIEDVSRGLDRFPLLQPFRRLYHLPRDRAPNGNAAAEALFDQPSLVSELGSGVSQAECFVRPIDRRQGVVTVGMAWAGRRELLERHGLFDACIVGGGDTALACAAYGRFESVIAVHHMNRRQQEYYLAWARPFYDSVRGKVSSIDVDIHHLWHGDMADRRPSERHQGLAAFDFDPNRDIARDACGCWRWNSDKPALHAYVRDYFASRNEDGTRPRFNPVLDASRA
jgi:hypothetical protein